MKSRKMFLSGAALVLTLAGCKPSVCWYNETRDLYYGIPVRISYYPENRKLNSQVWTYLESIDSVFNDYKDGSEISAINRLNATGDVTLSPMLAEGFEKARKAWQLSEGVFDVTCTPIRKLWRQAEKEASVPTDAEVTAVRERCGMNWTEQDRSRLTLLKPGLQFDFGGIVKGIIADHVIEMLRAGGAQNALVQIGGETAAFGVSQKKRPFRIAIQHPEQRDGMWSVIQGQAAGLSASTSGNYENPIRINGQEYYHIMDPRTGYPAKTDTVSVSIAFPETGKNWLTDTLSTTGVLLGPEKTFAIVQRLGGEAMFIVKGTNGSLREIHSSGWEVFRSDARVSF